MKFCTTHAAMHNQLIWIMTLQLLKYLYATTQRTQHTTPILFNHLSYLCIVSESIYYEVAITLQ